MIILPNVSDYAKKKAILTLNRIYITTNQFPGIDRVIPKLPTLFSAESYGVRQATSTLVMSIVNLQASSSISDIFSLLITKMNDIFVNNDFDKETVRSSIPCPFFLMMLFRILKNKNGWENNEIEIVENSAKNIIEKCNFNQEVNYNNPALMILSEIIDFSNHFSFKEQTINLIAQCLMNIIEHQDNLTFLKKFALGNLTLLVRSHPHLIVFVQLILQTLFRMVECKDNGQIDICALHLLRAIANSDNGKEIIGHLFHFLPKSPLYLRKDICFNLAILIRNFENDYLQGATKLIKIIEVANMSSLNIEAEKNSSLNISGSYEMLEYFDHKIGKIIIELMEEHPELQIQITEDVYELVKKHSQPSNVIIKLIAYLVGEYSAICNIKELDACNTLFKLYEESDVQGKSIILSSLVKLASKTDLSECKTKIIEFFKIHSTSFLSPEVSQRCGEYLALLNFPQKILFKILSPARESPFAINDASFSFNSAIDNIKNENTDSSSNGIEASSKEKDSDLEENRSSSSEDEESKDDKLRIYKEFQNSDTGTLIMHNNFIVRAATRYEQPRLNMIINIENLMDDPISIKNFSIQSSEELLNRIGDIPSTIDSNSRSSIAVDFVMMQMTDNLPLLTITIQYSSHQTESVSSPLPIFFDKWMNHFLINKDSFFSR